MAYNEDIRDFLDEYLFNGKGAHLTFFAAPNQQDVCTVAFIRESLTTWLGLNAGVHYDEQWLFDEIQEGLAVLRRHEEAAAQDQAQQSDAALSTNCVAAGSGNAGNLASSSTTKASAAPSTASDARCPTTNEHGQDILATNQPTVTAGCEPGDMFSSTMHPQAPVPHRMSAEVPPLAEPVEKLTYAHAPYLPVYGPAAQSAHARVRVAGHKLPSARPKSMASKTSRPGVSRGAPTRRQAANERPRARPPACSSLEQNQTLTSSRARARVAGPAAPQ